MSFFTTGKRSFANPAPLALVALALLGGCSRKPKDEPREPEPAAVTTETSPAPDLSGGAEDEARPNPAGTLEVVTADDIKRKVRASGRKGTLVNAWASFCGPCKREVPMLASIAENLRSRGLDVVLVSLDEPADGAKAQAFLRERKITLESYMAQRPLGPFKVGMNPRWRGMLPASFLFDDEGTLRYFWGGEAFESEVLPVLEAFLAGKPLDGEANFPVAPENPDTR